MIDSRELRNCFGKFATGVTVVSWKDETGEPHGITVNSFTSVSLDPALALVSIDRRARSCEGLKDRSFVINILAADQEAIAWQFAGKPQEGLTVEWEQTAQGPKIKGALATLACDPWRAYDGGDHVLYLGEIKEIEYRDGDALMFFQGKFMRTSDLAAL